jgi:hypothetical protein
MSDEQARRQERPVEAQVGREHLPALVDAFLRWPLPDSVCSDPCATMQGYPDRCGTNLLTAPEAQQMLEYVLGNAGLLGPKCTACNDTGWNHGAQPGPGPGYKTVRCKCGAKPN